MTPDLMFTLANMVAAAAWLLLATAPRQRWVSLITRLIVPGLFAMVYVGIAAATLSGSDGGFSSLDGVARLFANRWLLTAGWLHYLAFDLLIGTWEVRDAQRRGVGHVHARPAG